MLVTVALIMGALAIICSLALGYPLRDPDGFLGPAWIRLPLLVAGAFVADVLPRTLFRARGNPGRLKTEAALLIREHWTRERIILVIVGIVSFYVTYVSYRNIKNFLPFIMRDGDGPPTKYDYALHRFDHWLLFGHDPSSLLHQWLGTGISAYVLSWVYLIFLPMVPVSVVIWAVWSRNVSFGYWFITAQCICWALGTASYYAIPTLGPNFFFPWLYSDLPDTGVAKLQDSLFYARTNILFNPFADGVQSTAGFASLHVAITVSLALVGAVHPAHAGPADRALVVRRAGDHLDDVLRLALHRRRHRGPGDRPGRGLPRRAGHRPEVRSGLATFAPDDVDERRPDRARRVEPRVTSLSSVKPPHRPKGLSIRIRYRL